MQEALNNIAKHAGASQAHVALHLRDEGQLVLLIEDNGIGLRGNGKEGEERFSGFGMIGMRERAMLFGGSLDVVSAPGRGTALHFKFPVGSSSLGDHSNALRNSTAVPKLL